MSGGRVVQWRRHKGGRGGAKVVMSIEICGHEHEGRSGHRSCPLVVKNAPASEGAEERRSHQEGYNFVGGKLPEHSIGSAFRNPKTHQPSRARVHPCSPCRNGGGSHPAWHHILGFPGLRDGVCHEQLGGRFKIPGRCEERSTLWRTSRSVSQQGDRKTQVHGDSRSRAPGPPP